MEASAKRKTTLMTKLIRHCALRNSSMSGVTTAPDRKARTAIAIETSSTTKPVRAPARRQRRYYVSARHTTTAAIAAHTDEEARGGDGRQRHAAAEADDAPFVDGGVAQDNAHQNVHGHFHEC